MPADVVADSTLIPVVDVVTAVPGADVELDLSDVLLVIILVVVVVVDIVAVLVDLLVIVVLVLVVVELTDVLWSIFVLFPPATKY